MIISQRIYRFEMSFLQHENEGSLRSSSSEPPGILENWINNIRPPSTTPEPPSTTPSTRPLSTTPSDEELPAVPTANESLHQKVRVSNKARSIK